MLNFLTAFIWKKEKIFYDKNAVIYDQFTASLLIRSMKKYCPQT